jgi:competence protein ComEC
MRDVPIIPMGEDPAGSDAAGHPPPRPWQSAPGLSSITGIGSRLADATEQFLDAAQFDRAPWLAVIFMSGIFTWFALPGVWQWLAVMVDSTMLAGFPETGAAKAGLMPRKAGAKGV